MTREALQEALVQSVPRLNYVRAYNDRVAAESAYNANQDWAGIEELIRRRHV